MEQEIILETRELKKKYTLRNHRFTMKKQKDFLYAVNGVSLKVKKGETMGIVGESGCGKSTFARLVSRLIEPSSGSVIFKNQDLTKAAPDEIRAARKNIQMIFQDPYASLDPRKRVLNLLTEPLAIHNIGTPESRKEQALTMLENVGLQKSYAHRFPHEFSGGQCQRINIARSLMLNPELIICDEPVSALDVSIQAQIINLLIDLQQKFQLTYIFISHDLNVVRYFCDRIAVMYMGEIVEFGDAEEVYTNPKHEYTQKLLSAVPGKKMEVILNE